MTMRMFLKHPDWDMGVPIYRLPTELIWLLPGERDLLTKARQEAIRGMWADVMDGEYLDVRPGGELFRYRARASAVPAELPDGEYRLRFRGGYLDDWQPWAESWARRLFEVKGRGQIEVLLLATVADGAATIAIEAPA